MRIEEATDLLNEMTTNNHSKDMLLKCVKTLKNKPEILIQYSSLIALYSKEIDAIATNNLLTHIFQADSEKIHQLEILSSLSYSSTPVKHYLPSILEDGRSIAFEIKENDHYSYSMLLDSLPIEYSHNCQKMNNGKMLISIWRCNK